MKYIESFREGDRINDVYLCKFKQAALTKAGKPYDIVILQDKTGTIDSKIWDPGSVGIDDFDVMDYVCVTGDVSIYNGNPQLSIKRVRKVEEGEYNPSDYLPLSEYDIDGMFVELMGYINSIKNPYYSKLLHAFFDNAAFEKRFKFHSAAKSVHHGFVGGLLEHTLSVTRNCDFFAKSYPILNRDLLLTAAMFHDVGKVQELSTFPENDYTDAGQLLGHIYMGAELLGKMIAQIPGFPEKLRNELLHCILAHHGELEYGSPKKPALVEALALSQADNLDAKLQSMKELLDGTEEKGWLGFQRLFDSNVRKTSE